MSCPVCDYVSEHPEEADEVNGMNGAVREMSERVGSTPGELVKHRHGYCG